MRELSILLLATVLSLPIAAQRGGGRGGGFHGGGAVHAGSMSRMGSGMGGGVYRGGSGAVYRGGSGAVYRGGSGALGHGSYSGGGVYHGGYGSAWRRGYGGYRGGYGYGHRGYGWGGYYYGWPYSYWPAVYSGFSYGWGYPYYGWDYGYSYPSYSYPAYSYPAYSYASPSYAPQSPVVVVNEQPAAYTTPPPARDYRDDSGNQAEDRSPAPYRQPVYKIALQDHRILSALAYWVKDGTFHYVTTEHELKELPIPAVDRRFSEQLNRDLGLSFRLPAQ